MRKNIVAGNWKMNKTIPESIELAKQVNQLVKEKVDNDVEIVLAPAFIQLTDVKSVIDTNRIMLAAQNCSMYNDGAHTGETSANMLNSIGTKYVIVGHSERRNYHHEDNSKVLDKARRCIEHGINPIVCIGERIEERESGNYFNIVEEQIQESILELSMEDFKNVVIAYEPVWAIGTGVTASPEQAQEMHKYIRSKIFDRYGEQLADETPILYGGSCKPGNAKELFSQPDVDGGLIGGASLKGNDFVDIINSF